MIRKLALSVIVAATAAILLAGVQGGSTMRPPLPPFWCAQGCKAGTYFHGGGGPYAVTTTVFVDLQLDGECGCYDGDCYEADACAAAASALVEWFIPPLSITGNHIPTNNGVFIENAVYGCHQSAGTSMSWTFAEWAGGELITLTQTAMVSAYCDRCINLQCPLPQ